MSTQTAENFEVAVDPSYVGQSAAVMSSGAEDTTMAIGTPASVTPCERITVYANQITPIEYANSASPVACFDVVFSVGVQCEDGSCKTYQVVKRIGIDKCRIAAEVENSAPVSIVEAKKPDEKVKVSEAVVRARRLAGLE